MRAAGATSTRPGPPTRSRLRLPGADASPTGRRCPPPAAATRSGPARSRPGVLMVSGWVRVSGRGAGQVRGPAYRTCAGGAGAVVEPAAASRPTTPTHTERPCTVPQGLPRSVAGSAGRLPRGQRRGRRGRRRPAPESHAPPAEGLAGADEAVARLVELVGRSDGRDVHEAVSRRSRHLGAVVDLVLDSLVVAADLLRLDPVTQDRTVSKIDAASDCAAARRSSAATSSASFTRSPCSASSGDVTSFSTVLQSSMISWRRVAKVWA